MLYFLNSALVILYTYVRKYAASPKFLLDNISAKSGIHIVATYSYIYKPDSYVRT